MTDYEEHVPRIESAITQATGGLVTAWVTVAAVIADNGDQHIHTITSPGLPLWQRHGLLSTEAAASTNQPEWTIEGDGDD